MKKKAEKKSCKWCCKLLGKKKRTNLKCRCCFNKMSHNSVPQFEYSWVQTSVNAFGNRDRVRWNGLWYQKVSPQPILMFQQLDVREWMRISFNHSVCCCFCFKFYSYWRVFPLNAVGFWPYVQVTVLDSYNVFLFFKYVYIVMNVWNSKYIQM